MWSAISIKSPSSFRLQNTILNIQLIVANALEYSVAFLALFCITYTNCYLRLIANIYIYIST